MSIFYAFLCNRLQNAQISIYSFVLSIQVRKHSLFAHQTSFSIKAKTVTFHFPIWKEKFWISNERGNGKLIFKRKFIESTTVFAFACFEHRYQSWLEVHLWFAKVSTTKTIVLNLDARLFTDDASVWCIFGRRRKSASCSFELRNGLRLQHMFKLCVSSVPIKVTSWHDNW